MRCILWPCDGAEQCSQARIRGAHCLSPSKRVRPSSASLRTAGVGEPRKEPAELALVEAGGHITANMVLPTFAERKVGRLPGRDPACVNLEKGLSDA